MIGLMLSFNMDTRKLTLYERRSREDWGFCTGFAYYHLDVLALIIPTLFIAGELGLKIGSDMDLMDWAWIIIIGYIWRPILNILIGLILPVKNQKEKIIFTWALWVFFLQPLLLQ